VIRRPAPIAAWHQNTQRRVRPQTWFVVGELVEELRDRVHYLERVLEEEREARTEERRRHDTLMAQLMQRIPELEGPSETRESPRTGEERPEKAAAESRSATGEAQEGVQRPWWRRMFGS
jgi:hypothetical protein